MYFALYKMILLFLVFYFLTFIAIFYVVSQSSNMYEKMSPVLILLVIQITCNLYSITGLHKTYYHKFHVHKSGVLFSMYESFIAFTE